MDDLVELLAYERIRQLAARYALAVDTRDISTLVGLFVPDVRVGRDRRGREALAEDFTTQLRAIGRSVLNVGTHVIDLVDEDHATGWVYTKAEIEADGRWIHQAILYEDTYERVDKVWGFVRRIHRLWYGAEPGVNPLTLPPANWPEHHTGLGTVPECFATWQTFWR
ncbi:MAG: nuclear transport factor 2 family protein [Acidimicrobiia bacterium]|nr:nuclear transport factor 2 family protein [Acidimicrobiia bacterium]